jgi:hypothetical protein
VTRRKLIFFTTADPRDDVGAIFRAYHFATVGARKGLDTEVRLAGPAVSVTDLATLPDTDQGRDVRARIEERAANDGPFLVSL